MKSGWRVVGAWLALGAAETFLRAEEPQRATATPSGIEGAQKDYQAMKAPAATVETARARLPEVPAIELSRSDDASLSARRSPTLRERELERLREKQGKRNWLLDAMAHEKGLDESAAEGSGSAPTRANASEPATPERLTELSLLEAFDRTGEGTPQPRDRAAEAPVRVSNPLDGYMAGWMTRGDFELLGPKSEPFSAGEGGGLSNRTQGELVADRRASSTGLLQAERELESAAPTNPYLQAFAPMPLPPDSSGSAVMGVPATAVAPLVAPSEPAPPTAPSFREQVKAQSDGKYFKQLKRF